jgi:hypothetical protein
MPSSFVLQGVEELQRVAGNYSKGRAMINALLEKACKKLRFGGLVNVDEQIHVKVPQRANGRTTATSSGFNQGNCGATCMLMWKMMAMGS